MARRNLEVVITVRDAASAGIDKVKNKTKDAGDAANKANLDFSKFNKTLFATTAFVGTFIKGMSMLRDSLDQGAELDRLANQFERVLGPQGRLFDSLNSMTTTSVDKMEALRAGLKMAQLGIISNSDQAAGMIAKAGTAAKLAGLDAAEGVQKFTNFMTTGEVSQLEFLNLISRTNPALQAQLAVLNKAGGIMGTVVSTQAKLAMGQALLTAATKGNMHMARDLADVMTDLRSNFDFFKREIGRFIGTALAPLLDSFSQFVWRLRTGLEDIRKNHKEIVFLAKAFILVTGAAVGLAGALGTLSLMVKLLGFAGIGLPGLITSIITLGSVFLGVTSKADSFVEKLKVFGAFFKGIVELVQNFDPSTGFSKLSKATYDLLQKHGLVGIVEFLSKIIIVTKRVVTDMVLAFRWFANKVDQIFGGIFRGFIDFMDAINKPWSLWWATDAISPVEKFARGAIVALGAVGAFILANKGWGLLKGLLGRIPVIGKLFGGGGGKGNGPSGAANDPIFVVPMGGMLGGIAGKAGGLVGGLKDWIMKAGKNLVINAAIIASSIGSTIMRILAALAAPLIQAGTAMMAAIGPMIGPALAVAAAAALGVAIGKGLDFVINKYTQGETSEGYKGDILERGLFKLDKATGMFGIADQWMKNKQQMDEFQSKDDATLVNEFRKKQGLSPLTPEQEAKLRNKDGKPTPVTVPAPQSIDQISAIDSIGEQMKGMDDVNRKRMQSAVEGAFGSASAGGNMLTYDEMNDIMNNSAQTDYLKQISENTKPTQRMSTPIGGRRP